MKPDLLEALGQAVYNASIQDDNSHPTWQAQPERIKKLYRQYGKAAAQVLIDALIADRPELESIIKKIIEEEVKP